MGKHSAPRGKPAPTAAPATTVLAHPLPDAPAAPVQRPAAQAPTPRGPVPAALAQTAAFGGLALVVAVVALLWSGVGASVALAVGVGLLLVGLVGFLVVRRSGLLATPGPARDERAGSTRHP